MNDTERQESLKAAWLPPHATRKESNAKLTAFEDDERVDSGLRRVIREPAVRDYFLGRTTLLYPHAGGLYPLAYAITRTLCLRGVGAKVVHLLDLEDPPSTRGGIDFIQGLTQAQHLTIIGFFEAGEPKPEGTRRVNYLLRRLEASSFTLCVEHGWNSPSTKGGWWSSELISYFQPAHGINRA